MAEALVLVCDICGKPEASTVTFRVGNRNLQKDFCAKHLGELVRGARTPKRGRRPKSASPSSAATAARARRRSPVRKKAATRKRTAAKSR
jgi:hypothetical protein